MAIYLGNKKCKLNIGSSSFVLAAIKNVTDKIVLKSSDNSLIKTSNGLYLTVKESK